MVHLWAVYLLLLWVYRVFARVCVGYTSLALSSVIFRHGFARSLACSVAHFCEPSLQQWCSSNGLEPASVDFFNYLGGQREVAVQILIIWPGPIRGDFLVLHRLVHNIHQWYTGGVAFVRVREHFQ